MQRIRINQEILYREVDLEMAEMADSWKADWGKRFKIDVRHF